VLLIQGDRNHLAHVASQIREFSPDVVIDAICYQESQAKASAEVFRQSHARLIVLSSIDVYRARDVLWRLDPGAVQETPMWETAALRERLYPYRTADSAQDSWAYSYEKILVEKVFQACPGLSTTILRLPAVYGPDDYQNRVGHYLQRMDAGQKVILMGKEEARWSMSRGYVENIAAAIKMAVHHEKTAGEVFNLGEATAYPEAEWVKMIGEASGWKGRIVLADGPELPTHLRKDFNWRQPWVVHTRKFQEQTGFVEPDSPPTALRKTVDWIRAQNRVLSPAQANEYALETASADAIASPLFWN
jgi:nucleoside-diphosphate-sugar epimerase